MPIFEKPLYPQTVVVSNGIYFFVVTICLVGIFLAFDRQVASLFNGFFEEPNPPYYPYFKHYLPLLTAFWGAVVGLLDFSHRKHIKYAGIAMILNLLLLVLYSLTLLF